MKSSVTIILIILLAASYGCNCYHIEKGTSDSENVKSRDKREILETLKDKTTQLINYVSDKGRSVKNFYNKGKNKVVSYFSPREIDIINDNNMNKGRNIDLEYNPSDVTENDTNAKEQCSDKSVTNFMTTTQLTALHGYMSESHTIVTEDGYILTVHRIPHSKKSHEKSISQKTVLLHHGLLASSADWVIPGPDRGLAYILSDAGYDVWMANVRGNTYSKAHVTKNVNSPEFWDFTFHEVGQYDLPAVIEYIILRKGKDVKIDYVGFSMGTTVLFALLSTKPQYNDILRAGFALAPVVYMNNVKAPFKVVSKFSDNINYLLKLTGSYEFLPRNALLKYLSKHSCTIHDIENAICEMSVYTLCGHGREFDSTLFPMIVGHLPAGASTKTLVHYAQEVKSGGSFQMFDYGPEGNEKKYGESSAPKYPVEKITLPIALFSAPDDWLSNISDVQRLYQDLANPIEHYIVPSGYFNHIDFLFARDSAKLVYDKLLKLMHRLDNHNKTINS